ncbi:hypothetical protein HPB48_020963 [Haemaphysalis longicornis]|uniref:CCHC-type domain-containing protein n=1 Tax=Haemaphysalis longicornis TaxID=44386 RepID=A0A9J6FPV1_HAELO|nr:hypothetical protein HPB48_020963 [Haemaphysalis longicornis]
MRVEVEGVEIQPEQVTTALGWRVAGEKKTQAQQRELSLRTTAQPAKPTDAGRRPASFKSKLLKAARMPELPKDDIKIVMRPRGGLDVSEVSRFEISRAIAAAANIGGEEARKDVICPNKQQNIVIVSTPRRENADRYAAVARLIVYGTEHEVSAYESAPHGTVKGVIRGVPLTDTAQEINDYIVHEYNPTALQANRIGKTMSVVIAFNGPKVPNYVKYGNLLVECSLYRKQIDNCFQCGRLGHRMDVCPNPSNRICRGCGVQNPNDIHKCVPKCSLCGGGHLTADKTCKARYKTPYVVRRRRWERQRAANDETAEGSPPHREETAASPPPQGHRSRRSLSRGGRSRSESCASGPGSRASSPGVAAKTRRRESRSRSKTRSGTPKRIADKQVGWADKFPVALSNDKDFPPLTPPPPRNDCKECSELKKLIAKQNQQIQMQNQQIKALIERMEALDKSGNTEDSAKRKIAKKDTHPESPPVVAMEAERTEPSPPRLPQTEPTMKTVMDMLSQITNQLTQTNGHVSQIANQVGGLTEQMGNVTTRLDNLEAKYNQMSARMTAFDAKIKHATLVKKKSLKDTLHSRPHLGNNLANEEHSQDEEE